MTQDKMKKCFLEFFHNFSLPEAAKEQQLKVFRACCTRDIEPESFLPTYVQNGYKVMIGSKADDPRQYSLSCDTRAKELKRFVVVDSRYQPPWLLAIGVTHPLCGISCMTKDYLSETPQQRKSSHVDWWLYKEAEPWKHFKEIDYNEAK